MHKWLLGFCLLILLYSGCTTSERAVQERRDRDIVLLQKQQLLERAGVYLENRDYANALVNILRAENIEGEGEVDYEIAVFKNNLIDNLNARAIYKDEDIHIGKGLKNPLQYMIFYMEDEIIYPAFNVPVTFNVKKGTAQIMEENFTNTSGIGECVVSRVESLVQNRLVISAGVYFEIDGERVVIAKLGRDFTLHRVSIKERPIAFVIFEKNIEDIVFNSTSGTLIEDFFIKNGFSVSRGKNEKNSELFLSATNGDLETLKMYKDELNSKFIAFAYIGSSFSSKVTDDFYFAKSEIILHIMDTETDEILFSTVVQEVKGAGNTEEKAGRQAINEATRVFIEKLNGEIDNIELNR
jgi:hypothetical protein